MDEPPAPDQPLPEPPAPGPGPEPGLAGPSASRPIGPSRPVGNPDAGWLVLAGGILVLVGVFLPWLSVTAPGRTGSVTGKDLSEWGVLILGGFATVRGLSMVRPDRFRFALGTPLIGGVILAVLVASRWNDLQNLLEVARAHAGVTASLGIGIWMVIAGTACVLIGGVMAMRRGS